MEINIEWILGSFCLGFALIRIFGFFDGTFLAISIICFFRIFLSYLKYIGGGWK